MTQIDNQDTTSIDDEIDDIIVRHNQYIDAVWQGKHQMYALPETHQQIKALISDQVAKAEQRARLNELEYIDPTAIVTVATGGIVTEMTVQDRITTLNGVKNEPR